MTGLGGVLTFASKTFRLEARSRARSGVRILIGLLARVDPLPGGGSLARAALASAELVAGRGLGIDGFLAGGCDWTGLVMLEAEPEAGLSGRRTGAGRVRDVKCGGFTDLAFVMVDALDTAVLRGVRIDRMTLLTKSTLIYTSSRLSMLPPVGLLGLRSLTLLRLSWPYSRWIRAESR